MLQAIATALIYITLEVKHMRIYLMNSRTAAYLLIFALLVTHPTQAETAKTERIFNEASRYTLELSVDIPMPFVEDAKGSIIGTGFLIDKERGWLLTNAHVAGRSESVIRGRFQGQDYQLIQKIYIDPVLDIAVLALDTTKIPGKASQASLDCERDYKAGHPVGAYGHPWGLSFTATRGIISGYEYYDTNMIQMDAPVNGGNSGGPLISLDNGQVIGINTAKVDGDNTEGLNFAQPIKQACEIVYLLKKSIDPSPVNLGISFYEQNEGDPLKIAEVYRNDDLLVGDVVKSILGRNEIVENESDLLEQLRGHDGDIDLVVERAGVTREVKVRVERYPSVLERKGIYFSGMLIAKNQLLDKERYFGETGWVVNHVEDGTEASANVIGAWDYIVSIDNQDFDDEISLYRYLRDRQNKGGEIQISIKTASQSTKRLFEHYQYDFSLENLRLITISH